jgi:hypothetical protein
MNKAARLEAARSPQQHSCEIKVRVICYHSFQNLVSSRLLSENVEMTGHSITVVQLTVRVDRRLLSGFLRTRC